MGTYGMYGIEIITCAKIPIAYNWKKSRFFISSKNLKPFYLQWIQSCEELTKARKNSSASYWFQAKVKYNL